MQRVQQKNRTNRIEDVSKDLTDKLQQSEAKKRQLYELARSLDIKEN